MKIISFTSKTSESVQRLMKALGHQEEKALKYGCGVSKLEQYQFFQDHNLPAIEWTTTKTIARAWQKAGHEVMCRKTIKGQTGSGISVCGPNDELPDAKVYTKYISHKREFRVNLLQGKVINVREKVRDAGRPKGDFHVRNYDNGYTTAKCKTWPKQIVAMAEQASKVTESDFAGVDIGYNEAKDFAFLIEVNSGPSIEGSSVQEFAAAIKKLEV